MKQIGFWTLLAVIAAPPMIRLVTWPAAEEIEVVPAAADAGLKLFEHEWKPNDPLSPNGDGLGPVFNATSCKACHNQGGVGGGGPNKNNVGTFVVRHVEDGRMKRQGVVHSAAISVEFQELLTHVHSALPPTVSIEIPESQAPSGMVDCFAPGFQPPAGVHLSQRNTPAIFGAKLIDQLPDSVLEAQARAQKVRWAGASAEVEHAPVGRVSRMADGRVGRFGWKGQTSRLSEFVEGACANELGLGNPNAAQPASLAKPDYKAPGLDLTQEQCDQITAYCHSLDRPEQVIPEMAIEKDQVARGEEVFAEVGCADCHTPNLGSIPGIYSDLLLHQMGVELTGGGSYNDPPIPVPEGPDGPDPSEWQTPPLWGVADSAPYMHDGRSATLEQAIDAHGGQAAFSRRKFAKLSFADKSSLIRFLKSLRAPHQRGNTPEETVAPDSRVISASR